MLNNVHYAAAFRTNGRTSSGHGLEHNVEKGIIPAIHARIEQEALPKVGRGNLPKNCKRVL